MTEATPQAFAATAGTSALARLATERRLALVSFGAVGLHIVDDNFLHPESGTAATGHLLSGLVPLALIVAAAACYGRARPGIRAVLALVFGVLGVLARHRGRLLHGQRRRVRRRLHGLPAPRGGLLLLGVGSATLWGSRRRTDGRLGDTRGGCSRPRLPSS